MNKPKINKNSRGWLERLVSRLVPEKSKYYELIYAVESKWDGETRHETALRYIRQAETHTETAKAANVEVSRSEVATGSNERKT